MPARQSTPPTRALVLGGGGVAGIAWHIGMLLGLGESGVDLLAADVVIGTSAGAAAAAQATSGTPLDALFDAQVRGDSPEIPAPFSVGRLEELRATARRASGSPDERRAAIGRLALEADTPSEDQRRAVIAARLPRHDWPQRPLRITALDAHSGALRVFDERADVDLVDAVAASCAVPGVWPPVTIGARRYMDGGVRSGTNADLAAGHDTVVVLAPIAEDESMLFADVADGLARLRAGGRVLTITPDAGSVAAMGPNPLDPAARAPAARAGREQGRAAADEIAAVWTLRESQ